MRADGCLEVAALSRTAGVWGPVRSTVHGLASGACSGTPIREDLLDMAVLDSGTFTEGAAATPDDDVIARIVVLRREE